jgi:uncharacterized protein YndB with AHSA1/START domain
MERTNPLPSSADISLIVRRVIAASPEVVFAAWTEPDHLKRWWGPSWIECTHAEVDLRIGGRYRLANRDTEGHVIWITGTFGLVDPPRKLVYDWAHEPVTEHSEITRVTVRFEPRARATEVIVIHERFATEASRERHGIGWAGCLDGLDAYFNRSASGA